MRLHNISLRRPPAFSSVGALFDWVSAATEFFGGLPEMLISFPEILVHAAVRQTDRLRPFRVCKEPRNKASVAFSQGLVRDFLDAGAKRLPSRATFGFKTGLPDLAGQGWRCDKAKHQEHHKTMFHASNVSNMPDLLPCVDVSGEHYLSQNVTDWPFFSYLEGLTASGCGNLSVDLAI